jgi:predicted GIY-YIG superfamily endonuclease
MALVVYRITNKGTGKFYIGSTNNFEARKAEHLGQLRTKRHINRGLQFDFLVWKEDKFVFEIIHDGFKTREDMLMKEYEVILKTFEQNYNVDKTLPMKGFKIPKMKRTKSLRINKNGMNR